MTTHLPVRSVASLSPHTSAGSGPSSYLSPLYLRARSGVGRFVRVLQSCNICDRSWPYVILSTVGGDRRISAMTSASHLPNANRPDALTMSSRKKHLSLKAAVNAPPRRHPAAKDLRTAVSVRFARGWDYPPLSMRRSVGLPGRSFRPVSPGMGYCRGLFNDKCCFREDMVRVSGRFAFGRRVALVIADIRRSPPNVLRMTRSIVGLPTRLDRGCCLETVRR